jgi:hypothetical protein
MRNEFLEEKEKYHWGDLSIDGRIISKWILLSI